MLLLTLGLNSDQKKRELHTELSAITTPLTFDDNVAFLHERTLGKEGVSQRKRDEAICMGIFSSRYFIRCVGGETSW